MLFAPSRGDFDDICETLIDELCELEKNVNISLLHLCVEYFKETTQPLERLVKKAIISSPVSQPISHLHNTDVEIIFF